MSDGQPFASHEMNDEIHRVCGILERVASRFSPDSPEQAAIHDAAEAYILVHQRRSLLAAFRKLKQARGEPLSPDILDNLRRMGIDVDALEHDE